MSEIIKILVGIILVIAGIVIGAYVGIWICFIGGLVAIIEQFQNHSLVNIEAMVIVVSIVKILGASIIGCIVAFVLVIPGLAMLVK